MTDHTTSDLHPRRRWPLVVLLLCDFAWLGLVISSAAGARWWVPKDSGLAGSVIVLGYGVLGAGIGLTLAGLLGWKAPDQLLRPVTWTTTAVALAVAGWLVLRLFTAEAERRAEAGLDVPLPPPAGFLIESRIGKEDTSRPYREMTIDADKWTATWVAVGPEAATCTADLVFAEADALLRIRTEIRAARESIAPLCSLPESDAVYIYTLRETDQDTDSWQLLADSTCLGQHADVGELHRVLGRIPIDAVNHGRAACQS